MDRIKSRLHSIIFEAETPAGKLFDVALLIIILLSVIVVMLESVSGLQMKYGKTFYILEWVFTIFFSIEYILRIYAVRKPWKYITSFYGIIDFVSTIPLYISTFIAGSHYFMTIRALRLLRVFRVLKVAKFMLPTEQLSRALYASRNKIFVFLYCIVIIVLIMGSMMYLIEGESNSGFTSIPRSIYWAIVTLTTVGYGDISPQTNLGQFIAAILMILGYSVIAVPTGIVTVEMAHIEEETTTISCPSCSKEGHANDAKFCKYCGASL